MQLGLNFATAVDARNFVKFASENGVVIRNNFRDGETAVRVVISEVKGSKVGLYQIGDSHMKTGGVVVYSSSIRVPAPPAPTQVNVPVAGRSAIVTKDSVTLNGVSVSRRDVEEVLAQMEDLS